MLNEILRQLLIICRGAIVFLQCNPLIAIGASAAITLYTTKIQINQKRAKTTVGATLATGTVTVATVAIKEYHDDMIEKRLREKKEAYEATTSWLDSLTDDQLAMMVELVDKKIEEEEMKQNDTPIVAEQSIIEAPQPKVLAKTNSDDRKMM